jgi:hypothetical protein
MIPLWEFSSRNISEISNGRAFPIIIKDQNTELSSEHYRFWKTSWRAKSVKQKQIAEDVMWLAGFLRELRKKAVYRDVIFIIIPRKTWCGCELLIVISKTDMKRKRTAVCVFISRLFTFTSRFWTVISCFKIEKTGVGIFLWSRLIFYRWESN